VWALGLIAYELFTGEHFWRSAALPSATPMYLLREIVVEPIPPASQRGGGRLPEGFDAWFARCVARDPLARFANAGEAWAAMRHLLSPSGHFGAADTYPAGPAAALAPTVAANQAALAFSPTSPAGHTPLAVAGAISPPANTAASGSPGTATSRVALGVGAGIAVVGVVVGALLGRGSSGSATPLAAHPAVPSPPAVTEPEDDSTRTVAAPPMADGFADPDDGARETPGSPQVKTIGQHRVRILTRLVSNASSVAGDVIRSGVDWSTWRYTRCYETAFGTGREYPGGTVTVAFDILDQLPRHAAQQASTFKSASMNDCIVRTLSGQTLNAAGAAGAGHVVYSFKFVVD
jgi:serine/threonine-protein kinase